MGISRKQALDCFHSDDLIGIGMEADAVRRRLHPEGVVSYIVEQTIAVSVDEEGFERVCAEISGTLDLGGTSVLLERGPAAGVKIDWFERLFAGIKRRYPEIWLQCLSAREVLAIAQDSGTNLRETMLRLRGSGLGSLAGDSGGCSVAEWVEVHRTAHGLGMQTAVAMVFGGGETIEQRVDFLEATRRLQEETGGFTAFVPLRFRPTGGRGLEEATAIECLKTLAISRMLLDTIENVQMSWAAEGLKVRQMGLHFGANDVGPARLGGGSAGAAKGGREEDLRRIIRDAGFMPVQRDMLYRTMFLN
jgi:cyclic dehypoxanthinyl futalosine synthase